MSKESSISEKEKEEKRKIKKKHTKMYYLGMIILIIGLVITVYGCYRAYKLVYRGELQALFKPFGLDVSLGEQAPIPVALIGLDLIVFGIIVRWIKNMPRSILAFILYIIGLLVWGYGAYEIRKVIVAGSAAGVLRQIINYSIKFIAVAAVIIIIGLVINPRREEMVYREEKEEEKAVEEAKSKEAGT